MFDWNLQMRFWRSATEAMLEGATASFAAAAEFQSHLLPEPPRPEPAKPAPFDAFNPWSWWMTAMTSAMPGPVVAKPKPVADPFNPLTWLPPWATTPAGSVPIAPDQWMKLTTDFWFNRAPNWPAATGWMMWQTPMTLMLMSTGMPHSVASPAARASAASLDAADAAHQQMTRAFAAYRSDGGHASAFVAPWPLNVMSEMAAVTLNMTPPTTTRH